MIWGHISPKITCIWEILHIIVFHGRFTGDFPVTFQTYEIFCTSCCYLLLFFFLFICSPWCPATLAYRPNTLLKFFFLRSLKKSVMSNSRKIFSPLMFLWFLGIVNLIDNSLHLFNYLYYIYIYVSKEYSWLKIPFYSWYMIIIKLCKLLIFIFIYYCLPFQTHPHSYCHHIHPL